ncbi:MAG: hypothetical protein KY468_07120 [Armatimonadetes bacterium]|nr:hypothetical protein [Armatimonadota bacterium]
MAVCPSCKAGVGIEAETCPSCGTPLQWIQEPNHDPIEAIKEDIEDYVEETSPEDLPLAERQIDRWQPTIGAGPAEVVTTAEEAAPVAIYGAPDEVSAKLVTSLLRGEGIEATMERMTMAMLDTAHRMEDGVWGYVMVHQIDADRARETLQAYQSSEDNLTSTE